MVPKTSEDATPSPDPVSSGLVGVDCSTVANALEDALREWKQDGNVSDLRRSLLGLLYDLERGGRS